MIRPISGVVAMRASALALALAASGLAVAAHADDEYGIGHEVVVREAAASSGSARLTTAPFQTLSERFKLGEHDAFGAATAPRPSWAMPDYSGRLASTVPMIGGKPDVVGAGERQDELAREIYAPGSGTQ